MRPTSTTLSLALLLSAAPAPGQTATDIHLLEIAERDGHVLVLGAPARVNDRQG